MLTQEQHHETLSFPNFSEDSEASSQLTSMEGLVIQAEILGDKFVISSPEHKIFSGRYFSGEESNCEGDLVFMDMSEDVTSSSSELTDSPDHLHETDLNINHNNISPNNRHHKNYKNKLVLIHKTEGKCPLSVIQFLDHFGASGCVILDETHEIDDREEVVSYFTTLKKTPVPLLWLHQRDSHKFLQWLNLQLALSYTGTKKKELEMPHPFRLEDANHWRLLKSLLQNRRSWFRAMFGELKPPNMTPIFDQFYQALGKGIDVFQEDDKKNLVFLFVSGLYHGRFPGRQTNFQSTIKNMCEQYKIEFRIVDIDNDMSVLHNAMIIASVITRYYKTMHKQIVIVGHSKGAVDITAAITLYPKIRSKIRLFISLMGAFGGSPIASLCVNHTQQKQDARLIVKKLVRHMMRCKTDALLDITMESRHNFLLAHPYPVNEVPTVSIIATRNPDKSIPYKLIMKYYNEENDALITVIDALIPGSSMIYVPGMDHRGPNGSPLLYNNPDLFFPSVVSSALLSTSSYLLTRQLSLCKSQNCCSIPFDHITFTSAEPYAFGPALDTFDLPIIKKNMSMISPLLLRNFYRLTEQPQEGKKEPTHEG